MGPGHVFPKGIVRVAVCLLFAPLLAWAQTSAPASAQSLSEPQSRIVARVDDNLRVTLRGNTHPLAQPQFDRGAAPPDLPMARMLLVLKRSDAQEAALEKLLDDQQDQSSPSYHQWVTPDQFGQQFGPSDQDVQTVAAWLRSHGFQIGSIGRGRTVIEFSGTAAQVQEAFRTEIRKFTANGEDHWANASDPSMPSALTPVVAGVATLHNFLKKPQIDIEAEQIQAKLKPGHAPEVTSQSGRHALGPADYETIYNITPLIVGTPGISGPPAGFGTTIAVVGRSNINLLDVERFRDVFGLPNNNPQIFLDGPDPGDLGGREEAEAVLDTTWSGALAPGAEVWLFVSASTNTTDGVDLSEVYVIDNQAGTIMTESFGTCEAGLTAAEATNIRQLAEQAAAEGITYIVSAGDTGSAGCDHVNETEAVGPLSINALASTPFTVAVGGTEFNENGNDAQYWNTANNQYTLGSARSYIPEDVWNQSCVTAQCGSLKPNILASGGGVSTLFGKPNWQSGVAGIPNDGMRDVPDIALTAAGHDPYLLCLRGSCQPDAQGNFFFVGVAGTSAAAPSFAGIMALVNSQVVPLNSHPRLGQINYVLYRLAANQDSSTCNGSSAAAPPGSNCIFNDVTVGNNAVPGETGYGTATATYRSGPGFDLASGLGSLNVANLANGWTKVTVSPTTTALSLSPTSIVHGTSTNVSVGVTSTNGIPAGDVSLFQSGLSSAVPFGPIPGNFFTLDGTGSASGSTNLMPGGQYSVSAHYAGGGNFMASDSPPVFFTVTPEPSSTTLSALTLDQSGKFVSFTGGAYGSFVYLRTDVMGQSGAGYPSGTVNLADNGANLAGGPFLLNSQGNTSAPFALFTLAPGPHSIVAAYNGDASFNASMSPALTFGITQATTTTAVAASGASQGAQLMATISTSSGGTPPSGSVTFFIGGTQIGGPVPVSEVPATTNPLKGITAGAQATATFTDSQLSNGQYTLSATYSGDSDYTGSSAPPTTITVQADYTLAVSSNLITIPNPGSTGSAMVTVSGVDGFSGTVNLSCSNLPATIGCQFSPGSVSGSGGSTITITTQAPVAFAIPGTPSNWASHLFVRAGITWAFVLLLGGASRLEKTKYRLATAFVVFIFVAGCGTSGGAPQPSPNPPPSPGTVPGSYTVTIVATSGTLTHSTDLMLSIQ